MRQFTPEMLYADTTLRKQAYADLSISYADGGYPYYAVMAQWMSDIATMQAVMWERVMIAHPDPQDTFVTIGATLTQALSEYGPLNGPATTAEDSVRNARAAMATAFDDAAARAIDSQYLPLSHLAALPAPTDAESQAPRQARLGSHSAAALARHRRDHARASINLAQDHATQGDLNTALAHAWQADWATMEAYLLDSAEQIGDHSLISVDFRWAIAAQAVATLPGLPEDFTEAVAEIRDAMAKALGLVEGARLTALFEPLPASDDNETATGTDTGLNTGLDADVEPTDTTSVLA